VIAFDRFAYWMGACVVIAGGFALSSLLIYVCCDFACRRLGLVREFLAFAVQRRRRRRHARKGHR
jgi:hypothetical protein